MCLYSRQSQVRLHNNIYHFWGFFFRFFLLSFFSIFFFRYFFSIFFSVFFKEFWRIMAKVKGELEYKILRAAKNWEMKKIDPSENRIINFLHLLILKSASWSGKNTSKQIITVNHDFLSSRSARFGVIFFFWKFFQIWGGEVGIFFRYFCRVFFRIFFSETF